MLSSLGARRDQSPTGRQPPRKVFVREQEVSKPEPQPQSVPMIVVQEYQEEEHQIQIVAKPQLREETVEDLPHHSKPEADYQPQILPEAKPQGDLVGFVALGEPKRQIISDMETIECQPHHLDIKPTPEQIQQTPTRQQTEPKQTQMQLDTAQIQNRGTSQQQTLFQESVKVRKSQKWAENRPWLQQKAQAEVLASEQVHKLSSEVQPKVIAAAVSSSPVSTSEPAKAQTKVTWIQQQQQPITMTTSITSQAEIFTTHGDQAETKRVTQTHAKVTQAQEQQSELQAAVHPTVASQPMVSAMIQIQSEPKSVIQTQFQVNQVQQSFMQAKMGETEQVTQTKVAQVQQEQPVTLAKLGQVHQQPPVSQMQAEKQVPAVAPVTSHMPPQTSITKQHPQPFTATTFTQPPTKQSEMQPPVVIQIQRPVMAETQLPVMSQAWQYLPATGEERQTLRQPPTPIQPQITTQRQPHPVAAQSAPQQAVSSSQSQCITIMRAQPKRTSPIQPRIISMPQSQSQFYEPPQSPPQALTKGQTHDNIHLRPQSHIQQPQWRPVMPDIMTQSYYEAPHQSFIPSHMPPQVPFQGQSHPRLQSVTQTPAQPQQWAPLRGGLGTQTYTSVQGTCHDQPYPQSQGYHSIQPKSQQSDKFRSEPTLQPYSQVSPQSQVHSFVPSQHWQPVRQSDLVRHNYTHLQMSECPQAQHQVTPRPQSPPQQWSMQPETQSQAQFLKMFPQPMTHTPWVQPSFHTTVRPQGLAPQQTQTRQQQWPQKVPEVPFQVQIQSQTLQSPPQLQQKLPSPEQEQPQQQLVAHVSPPALAPIRLQGPAQQQPQTQQKQWPQSRAEDPFQVQIQSKTPQTQPEPQVLQTPQPSLQEQPQQHLVSVGQVKPPALFVPPHIQACSLVSTEQRLEALKQLSETLNRESELQECEMTLASIQPLSSGDHEMTPTDSG